MKNKRILYINKSDMEHLESLLSFGSRQDLDNIERLEEMLCFARIVEADNIPSDIVTLNSEVWVKSLDSDIELIFTLVLPSAADLSQHKISVLAPIGSVIIGRKAGDVFEWKMPGGIKRLKIEKVLCQTHDEEDFKLRH